MSSSPLFTIGIELLIKSSAVLLAASLGALLMRRASAAYRHSYWCAALCVLLVLPLTVVVRPAWAVSLHGSKSAALSPAARSVARVTAAAPLQTLAAQAPMPAQPASQLANNSTAWNPAVVRTLAWKKALLAIWAMGAALLLFHRMLGSLRLRGLKKACPALSDANALAMAAAVFQQMRITRKVELLASPSLCVPVTWGALRPVVVLPGDAPGWSAEQLEAALRHEAAHIARSDYFTTLVAQITCALYWPNPLAWMAARALHTAQEQAADDLVLRAGATPEAYATQLLQIARGLVMRRSAGDAPYSLAMARQSTLERRMLAIVDDQRDRAPIGRVMVARASLLAVLFAGLCASINATAAVEEKAPAKDATKAEVAATTPDYESSVEIDRDKKSVERWWEGKGVVVLGRLVMPDDAEVTSRTPIQNDGSFCTPVFRGRKIFFYAHGYAPLQVNPDKEIQPKVFDAGILSFSKPAPEDLRSVKATATADNPPGNAVPITASLIIYNDRSVQADEGCEGGKTKAAATVASQSVAAGQPIRFDGLSRIPYIVSFDAPGFIRQSILIVPTDDGEIDLGQMVLKRARVFEISYRARIRKDGGDWDTDATVKTVKFTCDGNSSFRFSERDFISPTMQISPGDDRVVVDYVYKSPTINYYDLGAKRIQDVRDFNTVKAPKKGSTRVTLRNGALFYFKAEDLYGIDVELLFQSKEL